MGGSPLAPRTAALLSPGQHMGTDMDDTKKMGTGIFPAARLNIPGPTEVELLLEQMMGAFPQNDQGVSEHDLDGLGDGEIMEVRSRLPRTMAEEAREPAEALTGEPMPQQRCPDCGGYHDDQDMPFGGGILLIFID